MRAYTAIARICKARYGVSVGRADLLWKESSNVGNVAIVLRSMRAVVSQRIQTPHGPGWHCAHNWRELESAAFVAIGGNFIDGPYVFRCPATLAARAVWSTPVQASLFAESEAQR